MFSGSVGSGGGSGVSTLSSHDTVGAVFAQLRALAGRMRNFRSLDWEYAVWQLAMHVVQPHKVFRMATYRKHYKNSMVRDDPAFLLVIVYILCVCAIASAVTLSSSVWHVLVLVPRFVLVDFLFIAIVTATLGWLLSNRVMRTPEARRIGATVEWWYLFDVYCSAFAPVALFGYGGLLVFLPLLTCGNVLCTVVANLYVLALAIFHVVLQFFGYSETRILQHVGVLVVPTALVAVLLLACTLVNFNVAIWLASFYF